MIVLGILAILAVIVLFVINPAEYLRRSRDIKRVNDIETLHHAIAFSTGIDYNLDIGIASTVYVSLPDDASSTCSSWGLPALPLTWQYHCVPTANLQKTDGTGWMPINFNALSTGSPLANLPIDPVNASTSGLYYTYNIGSWRLTAALESGKYQYIAQNDGGSDAGLFEIGSFPQGPDVARGAYAPPPTPTPLALLTVTKVVVNDNSFTGGTFPSHQEYSASNQPEAVAIGDLDNDGDADMAAANYGNDEISVLRNNGSGTFTTATYHAGTGYKTEDIAIGDLDNDGYRDLVAASSPTATGIAVLMNNGNGTFGGPTNYSITAHPNCVVIGDLDNDGDLDLAVTNGATTLNTAVLKNNGNGTFAAPVYYSSIAGGNMAVAIGDFNVDNYADLVVSDGANNTISIFQNNGTGAFTRVSSPSVGTRAYWIAVADYNVDGKPDIATADYDVDQVSVFLNSGTGTFPTRSDYPAGGPTYGPDRIAAGDFNADGKPDIVTANVAIDTISVLKNNGNGTFAAKADYPTGSVAVGVATGDLDGDGLTDIATANNYGFNVSVLLNALKGVGDFSLFVGATPVVSGVQNSFTAGTYTVSETGGSGYTAAYSGDCAFDGSITLAPGVVESCTVTNNDN